jgi:hypothetical protein
VRRHIVRRAIAASSAAAALPLPPHTHLLHASHALGASGHAAEIARKKEKKKKKDVVQAVWKHLLVDHIILRGRGGGSEGGGRGARALSGLAYAHVSAGLAAELLPSAVQVSY